MNYLGELYNSLLRTYILNKLMKKFYSNPTNINVFFIKWLVQEIRVHYLNESQILLNSHKNDSAHKKSANPKKKKSC